MPCHFVNAWLRLLHKQAPQTTINRAQFLRRLHIVATLVKHEVRNFTLVVF